MTTNATPKRVPWSKCTGIDAPWTIAAPSDAAAVTDRAQATPATATDVSSAPGDGTEVETMSNCRRSHPATRQQPRSACFARVR